MATPGWNNGRLKIAFGSNADLHMSRTKCIIMLMYETGFAIYFRCQL